MTARGPEEALSTPKRSDPKAPPNSHPSGELPGPNPTSGSTPDRRPKQEVCDVIPRSTDCICLGPCGARLSHAVLAALLEAVPVAGSVIPVRPVILALSTLVPGGQLKLEGVLAVRRSPEPCSAMEPLSGSDIAASARSSGHGRWRIMRAWWRGRSFFLIAGALSPCSSRFVARFAPSCRLPRARWTCRQPDFTP